MDSPDPFMARAFPNSIDFLHRLCLAIEIAATRAQNRPAPVRLARSQSTKVDFVPFVGAISIAETDFGKALLSWPMGLGLVVAWYTLIPLRYMRLKRLYTPVHVFAVA
jgi:hypothetical protein